MEQYGIVVLCLVLGIALFVIIVVALVMGLMSVFNRKKKASK